MADSCSVFVDAVQVALKAERGNVDTPCLLGTKRWKEHQRPPLIRWARGDIDHEETKQSGGDVSPILTRKQMLHCQVWHTSEEQADELLDDLIRAVRRVAGGSNCTVGRFSWVTEERPGVTDLGSMLEGFFVVDMLLPASNKDVVRVTLTAQRHTEVLDDEL